MVLVMSHTAGDGGYHPMTKGGRYDDSSVSTRAPAQVPTAVHVRTRGTRGGGARRLDRAGASCDGRRCPRSGDEPDGVVRRIGSLTGPAALGALIVRADSTGAGCGHSVRELHRSHGALRVEGAEIDPDDRRDPKPCRSEGGGASRCHRGRAQRDRGGPQSRWFPHGSSSGRACGLRSWIIESELPGWGCDTERGDLGIIGRRTSRGHLRCLWSG